MSSHEAQWKTVHVDFFLHGDRSMSDTPWESRIFVEAAESHMDESELRFTTMGY